NQGPAGTLNLALEQADYLGFGPSVERQSLALHTADLNDDGHTDLIIGDQYGRHGIISNYRQTGQEIELISDIIYDEFTGNYVERNLGGRIWPSAARLLEGNRRVLAGGTQPGRIGSSRINNNPPPSADRGVRIYPSPDPS